MTKKIVSMLLVLVLTVALMAGCGSPAAPAGNGATSGESIKLAVVSPVTGDSSVYGDYMRKGVDMALQEINDAGGVLGRPLEFVYEDDKGSSTDAVSVAQKIASDKSIVGVIGHVFSGCTLAAGPIYQNNGIPTIAVASTNPEVATIGEYVYRINVGDNYQGGALAKLLNEKNVTKAAVIYDNSDYGVGVSNAFAEQYKALNGEIVLNESYLSGADDFSLILTQLKQSTAEVIVLCGLDTDAAKIMMQSKTLGIELPVYATDGVYTDNFITLAKAAVEGVYVVCYFHPSDPSESVQNFIKKFNEQYDGDVNSWSPYAYDAVMLMAEAIKKAGSTDGAAIKDAITATTNFQGATGTINFTGAREPVEKELVILQIVNGEYVVSEN